MQLWPAILYSGGHKETQGSQGCGTSELAQRHRPSRITASAWPSTGEVSGMGLGLQTPLVMGCSGISQNQQTGQQGWPLAAGAPSVGASAHVSTRQRRL